MSVFDLALEKRFTDSDELATINVTSSDSLLIRDSETGAVMRVPFSTLASAIASAFSSSFASLVDGKVPAAQLPAYVDDVLEYATASAFPVAGEGGKIYVALDTNLTYRWGGSSYVEISQSLALGETSSTAYRGDRGKTAYDHSQATGNPHGTSKADVGLGNVDNTSDANKPVSTAQQTALDGKASASSGTWTPTPTNFTVAGGTATLAGFWNKIGALRFFEIRITPPAGGTTASTGASTYFTLPSLPKRRGSAYLARADGGDVTYDNVLIETGAGGVVFTPTWAASTRIMYIQGFYEDA